MHRVGERNISLNIYIFSLANKGEKKGKGEEEMRKTISVILAVVMVSLMLLFAACTPAAEPETSDAQESEEVSETVSESTAVEEEEEGPLMPADVEPHEFARVDLVNQLPEEPLEIAFLTIQSNAFFDLVRTGALAAEEYLAQFDTTVDYINMGDNMDADTINAAIDAAIVQGYDGIVVSPFSVGTEIYIDKAVDAGIPVVTIYGESTVASKRFLFIGQDAYSAGYQVGEYVVDKCPDGGQYGVITGWFGVQVHDERYRGFEAALADADADWESVGVYEGEDTANLIYDLTNNMITANDDLKAVYVACGGNFGCSTAIAEQGLSDEIISAGHDEVPENLDYVADGQMVVISQDTSGVAFQRLPVYVQQAGCRSGTRGRLHSFAVDHDRRVECC